MWRLKYNCTFAPHNPLCQLFCLNSQSLIQVSIIGRYASRISQVSTLKHTRIRWSDKKKWLIHLQNNEYTAPTRQKLNEQNEIHSMEIWISWKSRQTLDLRINNRTHFLWRFWTKPPVSWEHLRLRSPCILSVKQSNQIVLIKRIQ